MGSIVLYIMEWAFALIVLLTIYKAAFSGTTFYRFNRFYLLGATVLSALLPLLHITIPEKTPVVSDMAIEQMEFAQELSGTFILIGQPQVMAVETSKPEGHSMWAVILVCMYSAYVLMLLVGWSRSIIRARRFLRGKTRRRISRTVLLVTHDEDFGPFSWMNYIVISDTENGFARRASLRHEFAHIRLLHSVDLVFLLACTIVNPVCWLVLQEIKIVHEYEADSEVINRYGIRNSDYQKLLIMRTVGAEAYALASSFNLNIKKRIIMLNKNRTRKSRLMWLLLLIPLLGMTSVLFARTERSIGPDNVLNLSPSNDNDGKEYVENSSYFEVSGKVVDKDGNPIALAQFAVLPEISGMATLTKCVSDLKGEFAFSAQKGDIVTVSKDGYKSIKISVDKPISDLTVTLGKSGKQQPKLKSGDIIQGVVTDASHGEAPIMLADVYELDRNERIRAHAITDMEGNFSIRIVDHDDFIKVSSKGYQSALSEIKKELKIRLEEIKTEPYNYHELSLEIREDYLEAQVIELRHENGIDEVIGATEASKIQLHQLDEYLNGIDVAKNGIHSVGLTVSPNISNEKIDEVKRILSKSSIISTHYNSPMTPENDDVPLIMSIDEQPEFPSGTTALLEYLRKNIKYPADARENEIQGKVVISFVIDKTGNIKDAEVVKPVYPSLDAEALRVINAMPQWIPGKHNGKAVNVQYSIPVNFNLDNTPRRPSTPQWIYLYDVKDDDDDETDGIMMSLLTSSMRNNGQDLNLGNLNTPEVKTLMNAYKAAQSELQSLQNKMQEEIQAIRDDVDKKTEEYVNQKENLSESMRSSYEQELNKAQQQMVRKYQELQRELRDKNNEIINSFKPMIKEAWQSISKNGAYVYLTLTDGEPINDVIVSPDNMESAIKDLFEGSRKVVAIPFSDAASQQAKQLISDKYANKPVFYMSL